MVSPAPSSSLSASLLPTWSRRDWWVETWILPGCPECGEERDQIRMKVRTSWAKMLGHGLASSCKPEQAEGSERKDLCPQIPLWSQQESQVPLSPRLVSEK